jgi:hypothetical protein
MTHTSRAHSKEFQKASVFFEGHLWVALACWQLDERRRICAKRLRQREDVV